MNLLVIGATHSTRAVIEKLLVSARHTLDFRTPLALDTLDLVRYDMLVVDGARDGAREWLPCLIEGIRAQRPEMPIIVLNCLDDEISAGTACDRTNVPRCGIVESRGGLQSLRCGLKELALNDRNPFGTMARLAVQPVTFEYQFESGV